MRIESRWVLVALIGALAAAPSRALAEPAAGSPGEASEPASGASAAGAESASGASAAASPEPASGASPADTEPAPRRRRVGWYDIPARDPRRVSIGANLQVDLLGLAIGIRPEVLYRPFRATRGFNLRFGFGLLPGPEYFFLPIDVGWRQHFVPHHRVTLELGAGYEQQFFFVRDAAAVTRGYVFAELGLAVRVVSRAWIGVQFVPGWAPFSHPGPGIATRLGFRWDFGGATDRASARRRGRAPV